VLFVCSPNSSSPALAITATHSASGSDASLSALAQPERRRVFTRSGTATGTPCVSPVSSMSWPLLLAVGLPALGAKGVKPQPPTGAAIVPKHCMPRLEGLIIPNWICRTLFRLMNVIQRPVILLLADSTVTS
jgi:hypothetical protein